MFDLDETHPIPNLNVIDVNTVKKSGGSDLLIVIAQPLRGDRRSLERLLRKVEVYLNFIKSEQFELGSGKATAENTNIVVYLHSDSDVRSFDLLERNKVWVRNNDATLVINTDPLSLN